MPIFRSVQLYNCIVMSRIFSNLPCRQFFRKNLYLTTRKDENNNLDPLQKFLDPSLVITEAMNHVVSEQLKIIIFKYLFNLYVVLAMDGRIKLQLLLNHCLHNHDLFLALAYSFFVSDI